MVQKKKKNACVPKHVCALEVKQQKLPSDKVKC